MAFGFEFAGSVVAGLLLGYYLDDYFGTSPFLMLLFSLVGMGGSLYRLIWSLKKFEPRNGPDREG